jgi:hypothetical protein
MGLAHALLLLLLLLQATHGVDMRNTGKSRGEER